MNTQHFSPFVAGFWRLKNWGMGKQELLSYVEECIDLGVTSMDHAMVYRSEAPFGEALALNPSLREKLHLITKFGIRPQGFGVLGAQAVNHYDSSASAMVESVEASLRDLQTDYVDVLLIHRPDYLMDVHEVADAFEALHRSGKVKDFGVSNFTVPQFERLASVVDQPLVTNQIECSPYEMSALEDGTLEQCQRHNATPLFWSCLAGGKLMSPQDEKGMRILSALQRVQEEVGARSLESVVYAWVRALPSNPIPLLGTRQIARVKLAVEGLDVTLNREQWYRIWEASNGAPVP